MSRPIKLFFSYSRQDELLCDELAKRLKKLEQRKVIEIWRDSEIGAGENRATAIEENLKSADIILLLVSPDFLHSNFGNDAELTQAMERHRAEEACVIPIILRPCNWEDESFAALQALPKNAEPITLWVNQDSAFLDVENGIRSTIKRLREQRKKSESRQNLVNDAPTSLPMAPTSPPIAPTSPPIAPTSPPIAPTIEDKGQNSEQNALIIEQDALIIEQDAPTSLPIAPIIEDKGQNSEQDALIIEDKGQIIEDKGQIIEDKGQIPAIAAPETQTASGLQTFNFEIITVNDRGQEIDRRPGQASYFREELEPGVFLDMVSIPGGVFWMGEGDSRHQLEVKPFFMGKFAVTQAQWRAIAALPKINQDLKSDPAQFKGNHRPVEQVSWQDAIEFCDRLSQKTGNPYQLPNEAEWEYACRAGTTTPFHFGETITSDLVNCDATSTYAKEPKGKYREQTIEIGHFPPNAFGLYEMHGNLWEWCSDREADNRYLRGGSWFDSPRYCCSASRTSYAEETRLDYFGFRVVCLAPKTL